MPDQSTLEYPIHEIKPRLNMITKNCVIAKQFINSKGKHSYEYYGFDSYPSAYSYIMNLPEEKRTFNNMCKSDEKQKLKLDIDLTRKELDQLDKEHQFDKFDKELVFNILLTSIHSVFKQKYNYKLNANDLAIYDSSRFCLDDPSEDKISFHFEIQNYAVTNSEQASFFTMSVKKNVPEWLRNNKIFDLSVYSNNHPWRLPFNRKTGNLIYKQLISPEICSNCIQAIKSSNRFFTNCLSDNTIFLPDILPPIKLDNLKPIRNFIKNTSEDNTFLSNVCWLINPARFEEYTTWCNLAFAIRNEGGSLELFDQLSQQYNAGNYDEHSVNNLWKSIKPSRSGYSIGTLIKWAKEDNPNEYNKIQKPPSKFSYFNQKYLFLSEDSLLLDNTQIIHDKYMIPLVFSNENAILMYSFMGTGKSYQIQKYLSSSYNTDKTILSLSCRQIFAMQFSKELNLDCYLDLNKTEINYSKKLMLSAESLYKLNEHKFDIVIIDEIESFLNQFNSEETMKNHIKSNTHALQNILKNAKNIICADAFLSQRSIDLFQDLDIKYKIIYNANKPSQRYKKFIKMNHRQSESKNKLFTDKMVLSMSEDLKNGQKIYCVSGSRQRADSIFNTLTKKHPDSKILIYTSDTGNHQDFKQDINQLWKVDCLIFSTCITVGLNFTELWFDRLYCYFSPVGALTRDVHQAIMRIRHIKNNDGPVMIYTHPERPYIYPSCCKKQNTIKEKNIILNTMDIVKECTSSPISFLETNWIFNLRINNLMESNISHRYFLETLDAFFDKCNYVNLDQDRQNCIIKPKNLKNIIEFSERQKKKFNEIESISSTCADNLRSKQIKGTIEDKECLELCKYFFCKKFKDSQHPICENTFNSIFIEEKIEKLKHIENMCLNKTPEILEYLSKELVFYHKQNIESSVLSSLISRLNVISKICKHFEIDHPHDDTKEISSDKITTYFTSSDINFNYSEVCNYFDLRQWSNKIDLDNKNSTRNMISVINRILSKWSGSKLEVFSNKRVRKNGKRIQETTYKLKSDSTLMFQLLPITKLEGLDFM